MADTFAPGVISRALLVCVIAGVASACSHSPRHRLWGVDALTPGDIFDVQGKRIGSDALRNRLVFSDVILVGESHGNACDHQFQARLLASLRACSANVVVGLEQVTLEHQKALDEFYELNISLESLPLELQWKENWGFPYDAYAPIFEQARATSTRLAALSLPKKMVKAFASGEVTPDQKKRLPEKVIPPPPEQLKLLKEVFNRHPHGGNFERFVSIQSLWDTHMAERVVRLSQKHNAQVLVLTGEGHVSHGYGIASRVARIAPNLRIASFLPWRGSAPLDKQAADFFYFCPENGVP